jgi:hypothetical protein
MSRLAGQLIVLSSIAQFLSAQSAATIADHVTWERDFPNLAVSVTGAAVADRSGNLWAVSDNRPSERLICIRPDGVMVVNTELPKEINPIPPSDKSDFSLAVSPSGTVVLIARYSHAIGKAIYFDGAAFGIVKSDGTLGVVKRVARGGPEFKEFIALSDEHFLLVGDQSPMVVIRLSNDGDVDWRRTFPKNWVLPSASAIEDGSACIVSPEYGLAFLHLIWIDPKGVMRHQEQLIGRRSQSAAYEGSCTILYDLEPGLRRGEFALTSFDRSFKRVWTTPVLAAAPQGGVYGMAAVSDGYVVTIGLQDGVFLAKYALGGQVLWAVTDRSRQYARLIVPAGDSFYLIGAGPKEQYSLHVIRAH